MYIAILGRQPALGSAELERLYGDVTWFSRLAAIVNTPELDLARLGGTQKAGRIVAELPHGDWVHASRKLVAAYAEAWREHEGKITLGISAYGFREDARDVQKTGIILKKKLKESGTSLRLIPQDTPALSTATSHHNKLGLSDNKVELLVVRGNSGKIIIAESIGAQNITAYAKRDQGRPKRDAFVGMLPPKLAQIIINLASSSPSSPAVEPTLTPLLEGDVPARASQTPQADGTSPVEWPLKKDGGSVGDREYTLLDPFCGTGVILQEDALIGYRVYGTDLSPKMVDYASQNLDWLAATHHAQAISRLEQGDAMTHQWQPPVDLIACETYLGQPFSAPPSPTKLREVRGNCNHIISEFLRNAARQLAPGTPLCIAVPAWRAVDGSFTHLPLTRPDELAALGYQHVTLSTVTPDQLLYYREDQVVARELLVLTRC